MTPLRGRLSWIVVGVLCLAGCGSTVQTRTAVIGSGGQNGLGGDGGATSGASSLTPGGAGSSAGVGRTGSSASSGSLGTSGTSGTSGSLGSGSSGGSGGTGSAAGGATLGGNDPVRIGYLYSSDQQAVLGSFGASGIVAGDTKTQYTAIANDINKYGGVLGHQLLLVGYDYSTAGETSNPSDEENKECTYFTQDQHVFAVLQGGQFLSPCLAKHGIPTVNGGQFDDPKTIDSQLIYDGGGMLTPVLARAYVDRLVAQSYFTGWNTMAGAAGPAPVRVGLIYQDLPVFRSYYADVKNQLRAHGVTVNPSDEFIYSPTADGVATQSQAAVVKFNGDGVTHVFGAGLLFFKDAENQKYYPRYGFDSIAPPALLQGYAQPKSLHGALGIGWRPTWDVNQSSDPGPVSPLATRCTAIERAAGQDVTSRTVLFLSHTECEQLWSLKAAFEKGGAISLAAMKSGFDALGSPTPVVSFGERWAPDRHASNTTVADLYYRDSCSCFAYTQARTSF